MRRSPTQDRAETEQACPEPGHALVAPPEREAPRRTRGGRPLAGFLTQLIVSFDPSLRPSRAQRTARAAALYARTARGA